MRDLIIMAAVAFAIALPREAASQARTGAGDLKTALSNLQSILSTPQRNLGTAQPRLVAAVQWLSNNYTRANPAEISGEYARSIEIAAELLKGEPTAEVVADVADELEAKVEHCRLTGVGMGGSVLLKVNTRRGSAAVGDWQVLYLLKIYERVSQASPGNFPRLSTPTETPVEPGRYWVWARDPSTGKVSDRSLVKVAGEKEVLVDLPIP
jgi:hypothetical protein